MKDYIEIGQTPPNEACAQVGQDDYSERAVIECRAYINQLWRYLEQTKGIAKDNAPESFALSIKSNPHDFGTYYEVIAKFDDENEDAMNLAFFLESNGPGDWDALAKEELSKQ